MRKWAAYRELWIGFGAILLALLVAGAVWLGPRVWAGYYYRASKKILAESSHSAGLTRGEYESLVTDLKRLGKAARPLADRYGVALLQEAASRAIARHPKEEEAEPIVSWRSVSHTILGVLYDDRLRELSPGGANLLVEFCARDPEAGLPVLDVEFEDRQLIYSPAIAAAADRFLEPAPLERGKPLFMAFYTERGYLVAYRLPLLDAALRKFQRRFPEDEEMKWLILKIDSSIGPAFGEMRSRGRQVELLSKVFATAPRELCMESLCDLFSYAGIEKVRDEEALFEYNLTPEELAQLNLDILYRRFPGETWYPSTIEILKRGGTVSRGWSGKRI